MRLKDFTVKIKAAGDLTEGQFEAYASVFGNEDSYGDVVMPGAFADSLTEWKSDGHPIPLLWGHNMSDPDYNVGSVDAVEDEHGLKVTGTFDLDSPKAAQTYRLVKSGRVNQMSFAYDVIDGGPVTENGRTVYQLRKLKLHEVSIVPLGANQETEILAVKAAAIEAEVKAGRVLAQKHIDSLRTAQEAIGAVIAAAEADQEKAAGHTDAKPEEPAGAKGEEPRVSPSAISLATHQLQLLALNI